MGADLIGEVLGKFNREKLEDVAFYNIFKDILSNNKILASGKSSIFFIFAENYLFFNTEIFDYF